MLSLLKLGASVHAKASGRYTSLHVACEEGKVDAADLLPRWGADETAVTESGKTPIALVPPTAGAAEQDRPRLERLSKLLANAPLRDWRRRGFLAMCRKHPDRVRLTVEIPDEVSEAVEQQRPQQRPSRRARRGRVKVEVDMGSAHGWGEGQGAGSSARAERIGARDGSGGGEFDDLAAWPMAVADEEVFRKIVGFLY
eukprot:g13878.t1